MTHICVSDLTSIGSYNGLSPGRRQAIIRTNAGILLIRPLGTNFSEFLVEILIFSFKKMRLKVSSAKRRSFCLGLNQLIKCALIFVMFWFVKDISWGANVSIKNIYLYSSVLLYRHATVMCEMPLKDIVKLTGNKTHHSTSNMVYYTFINWMSHHWFVPFRYYMIWKLILVNIANWMFYKVITLKVDIVFNWVMKMLVGEWLDGQSCVVRDHKYQCHIVATWCAFRALRTLFNLSVWFYCIRPIEQISLGVTSVTLGWLCYMRLCQSH